MAFPLAIAGIGASIAGAGVGAMGQIYQGQAQANQANYQAGIADINAKLAASDANYALATGEVEAEQTGRRYGAEIARTKAAYGAGNIGLSTGSPKGVINSEIALAQQSEGIVRANAAKRAYGFEVASAEDTAQGNIYRSAAATAPVAAMFGATSTILGGVGQATSMGIQAKQSGIFNV